VSIVIAVINGIEISHNYLRQKVQRRPLRALNCLRWAVYISVAQWSNIHRPFPGYSRPDKYPPRKIKKYAKCTFHHIAGKPPSRRILWNLACEVRSPT